MYSRPFSGSVETRRPKDMSYMFGPHMSGECVYFGGDGRESTVDSSKIPFQTSNPPAWLVADWILAQHRGEPLSANARAHCSVKCSSGLNWLVEFLQS
jgi:hypothetical protein